MKAPIDPPISKKTKQNKLEKFATERNVTVTAIIMPTIPNKFPCLEVSGEDKL